MKTLQNKVVLITGASSGIGRELARCFAKEGAKVVVTARREERLQELVNELKNAGQQAMYVRCDVNSMQDLQQVVAETHKTFGPIDITIANAGYAAYGITEQLDIEVYRRQFETNVFGVLNTIYATLDDLKQTKGQIVLIGSIAGFVSPPQMTPYAMAKAAIRALADSLYADFAALGIDVTLIVPGYILTEISHIDTMGHYHEKAREGVPLWLKMAPDKAAKEMLNAIRKRKREKVITLHGKIIMLIYSLFPRLAPNLFRMLSKK